jgi:hypothetical protein
MTQEKPELTGALGEHFPHWWAMPPVVVLPELYRIAEQARTLYLSDNWEFVREVLRERNRTAEHAQALRAVATVATVMAQNLEETPTNYGIQH